MMRPIRCELLFQISLGVLLGFSLVYLIHISAAPVARAARPADPSSRPVAAVEPERCDLGTVTRGEVIRARFEVSNRGDRRLILQRIGGGCGCASTGEKEIMVKPGGRQTVEAQMVSKDAAGMQAVELLYRTNDPQWPLLRVPCSVYVAE